MLRFAFLFKKKITELKTMKTHYKEVVLARLTRQSSSQSKQLNSIF